MGKNYNNLVSLHNCWQIWLFSLKCIMFPVSVCVKLAGNPKSETDFSPSEPENENKVAHRSSTVSRLLAVSGLSSYVQLSTFIIAGHRLPLNTPGMTWYVLRLIVFFVVLQPTIGTIFFTPPLKWTYRVAHGPKPFALIYKHSQLRRRHNQTATPSC